MEQLSAEHPSAVGTCVVISQDQDFFAAVEQYSKFLRLPLTMTPQAELTSDGYLSSQCMVAGLLPGIEMMKPVRNMRSRGLFQPVFLFGSDFPAPTAALCEEFEYLFVLEPPFQSNSFVNTLHRVAGTATNRQDELKARQSIELDLQRGRFPDAIQRIKEFKAQTSDVLRSRILVARALIGQLRLQDALDQVQRALTEKGDYIPALWLQGEIYLYAGKSAKAEEVLLNLLGLHPWHALSHLRLGDLSFGRNDLRSAGTYYRKTLEIDPIHTQARCHLAALELSQGKAPVAKGLLHGIPSGELQRTFRKILFILGMQLQFPLAEAFAQHSSALNSDAAFHSSLWIELGIAAKKRGKLSLAQKFFLNAKKSSPPGNNLADQHLAQLRQTTPPPKAV